jgi:hypothetical protein
VNTQYEFLNRSLMTPLTSPRLNIAIGAYIDSKLDYYFNPFLAGMAMWQGWLDMYNEFVAINIRLSLNWLNSYRNY